MNKIDAAQFTKIQTLEHSLILLESNSKSQLINTN